MADRNFSQVESVFHNALDLPAGDRSGYIKEACNGDDRLAAEVSSLVSTFEHSNGFMEQPALNLGLNVMHSSSQESLIGKTFGVYRIISQLGKGGMGEVYLAEDTRLNRKVALKFLSQELVDDKWAKRQLVKEAQAAAMLDHANICPVYGIEEHGEYTFIVMQFVEGETLCDLIQKQSITPEQTISLARQIAGALAEAHAHGIIHRDIKPRNIMVTNGGTVKVLDFGLAKSVLPKSLESLEDSISKFTDVGLVPGTIRYMSPEQLCNERLDYRSDVFSVGTLLYELVEGKSPFCRKSEAETISAILSEPPPPINRPASEIPQSLARIVGKCLEKQKEARFQSASELLLALHEGTPTYLPSRRFPLNLPQIALFALVAIILIAVSAIYFYQPVERTLAVLPFSNKTGDAGMDYLTQGMGRSLIDQVSAASGLRVLTNTAVSGYRNREADSEVAGRNLKVDAVVTGTLIKEGEQFILLTRLVRSSDGFELWNTKYPVQLPEVLNLQRSISRKVISTLSASISEENKNRAVGQTDNAEALRQYWLGRSYWENGKIDDAIASFNRATELDPVFALAWAGLADSYALQPTVAYGSLAPEEARWRATAAATRAVQRAEILPESHISMGVVKLRYDWDWAEAEAHFKRAIALDGDKAAARVWYASLLTITGRFDEALVETKKARDLDPFNPVAVMSVGRAYYRARRFDEAIDYLEKTLQENPDNSHAKYVLGYAYLKKGMLKEAINTFEDVARSKKWLAAAPLGFAYARNGEGEKARKILEEMEQQSQKPNPGEKSIPVQERAIIYIGLRDYDSAFAWLEKSYAERFPPITSLTSDPIFDDLRSDPRFANLAGRIGLTP